MKTERVKRKTAASTTNAASTGTGTANKTSNYSNYDNKS